jgi:hypothetical protein
MVGLSPLGKLWRKNLKTFKNWELIYTAKLVSTGHINVALLNQVIAQALRDNAGSIGYLIADDATDLIGEGKDE